MLSFVKFTEATPFHCYVSVLQRNTPFFDMEFYHCAVFGNSSLKRVSGII